MRAVVTGASGLLGGNLALLLQEAGHDVVCTRRAGSRVKHLEQHGVKVAFRGAGVRVGIHLYNTRADIDRLVEGWAM